MHAGSHITRPVLRIMQAADRNDPPPDKPIKLIRNQISGKLQWTQIQRALLSELNVPSPG
eukprot:UN17253